MTDTQPTPVPSPDFAAWEQNHREHESRIQTLLPVNKAVLFDVLAAAGIENVIVNFDGYGDSGQVENIEARNGDDVIELPPDAIEIASPVWNSSDITCQTMPVREAIEHMAYEFLAQTHCGWENNDGAYGDFTFNVAERTITLDYNERYTETNYSYHEF